MGKKILIILGIVLGVPVAGLVLMVVKGLAGYGQVNMVNVSSDPMYSQVLGQKFRVKGHVEAYGLSSKTISAPPIDYLKLVSRNFYNNRFVLSRKVVEKDTVFQIAEVEDSTDWLATKVIRNRYTRYVVTEIGSNQLKGPKVTVNLVGDSGDATFGLDADVYEKIFTKTDKGKGK